MKFPHLAIGKQFEYQGKTYVKVGPLTAQDIDSEQQRMVPRSALVTPLATPGVDEAEASAELELSREAVMRALVLCEQRCLAQGDTAANGAIRNAFDDCRKRLGLV